MAMHGGDWDQNWVLGVWVSEASPTDEHLTLSEDGAEREAMSEVKGLPWSCRAMSGRRCCVCGRRLSLSELTQCRRCGRICCSIGLCSRSHWCKAGARGETQHPSGTGGQTTRQFIN